MGKLGRPRIVRTAEEQAECEERRRQQRRDYNRRQRARAKAENAASDFASEERHRQQMREANRRRRAQATDEDRAREAARKRQARSFESAAKRQKLGEALPAADGVKARRARVHRTERRWPLVTCPHHSTSAAGTLRVATADFSAVFPDIDFKQAVEAACDKAPFIEASLASTTCRVEPWRGLQDKCVGECEALLQHAEQSCQTEHHITLVRCTKPQVSTCSVEVQADPWWQHHCGIQPIGVDLCET
ncbi:uncharacterized protein [Dermacentor andersoni]|uniref:uncharacterized protein isoform X8 n=1 Tax=Dermacentor andersoni TaxID=34620 RepID=UPI003B3A30DF